MEGGGSGGGSPTQEAQGSVVVVDNVESHLRSRIAELEEENDILALCSTEVDRQGCLLPTGTCVRSMYCTIQTNCFAHTIYMTEQQRFAVH